MEKKVLVSQKLGAIGSCEVAFEGGQLKASVAIDAIDLAIEGLKIAKEKIPGHIDDLIIDTGIAKLQEMKTA